MKTNAKQAVTTSSETTYCMIVGNKKIPGVTIGQLQELHLTIGRFMEREKAPFNCKMQEEAYDYRIHCAKNISLYSDEDHFQVDYSVGTFDGDIFSMPAERMKRVALAMLDFLKQYGENGDRKIYWDKATSPVEKQKTLRFSLEEDHSLPVADPDAAFVNKYIEQEEHGKAKISYSFSLNEKCSPSLSFEEFACLYQKLGEALK